MDQLLFFYNFKKKAVAVINLAAYKAMRPDSLATHGIGLHACYSIYSRPVTEIESPYYASLYRAKVWFYDNIDLLIQEELKAGVDPAEIEKLRIACQKLEFKKHQPEIQFEL